MADDPIIPQTSDDGDTDNDEQELSNDTQSSNRNIANLAKIDTAPKHDPKLETRTTDAPTTPAPKPPAIKTTTSMSGLLFDRTNTPQTHAPKPPSFDSATSENSQKQLIAIREDPETGNSMQSPVFNDYTQLCCCLIFFFAWTGLIIVAYVKAKNAVQAYKRGNYMLYKSLNNQARTYMVISVTISLLIVCAAFVVVVTVLETRAPDDAVEQIPEA
uniref:Uncharacterized protein n=1 Tax=Elphidium margaritaceum TaxID=933848 RepID=A0A7S0XS37_9EUKA|mmetsp:Transcript_60/g.91  ORF Transcript_60/g.91 Transcript_60/m.91 type:complete len:216 (+) Transcript_60:36-683(+)